MSASPATPSPAAAAAHPPQVVVIGDGHIGRHVAAELAPHVHLLGVLPTRNTSPNPSCASSPSLSSLPFVLSFLTQHHHHLNHHDTNTHCDPPHSTPETGAQ